MQGCDSSEETNDTAAVSSEEQDYTLALTGSVGDGPVVDSTLTVLANDNTVLNSTRSDQSAGYNLQIRTKGKHYPLTIEASGGLDLVTRLPLDMTMSGAVINPRQNAVVNVNPFSTLAVAAAKQMNGGLNSSNLSTALNAVLTELNLGMTTALSLDPMSTPIDNGNLAEIVKSSEALAEIFRRTVSAMWASSFTASMDFVIDAIAADLVDGVLDGRGAGMTNRHVSAVTMLVASQVSLETIRNELVVNGQIATPVLDSVITQLAGGQPAELTDARPVTANLIELALDGVDAAMLLGGSSNLDTVKTSLTALRPGESAAAARQALPSGAATMLSSAITQIGSGSTSDIDVVLTGSPAPAPGNTPPTISGSPPVSVTQDAPYSFVPTAADADGDALTYLLAGSPGWLAVNAVTGEISGTPGAADVGVHSNIQLSVTDGQATTGLPVFSIAVAAAPVPNNAPVISGTPATSVMQDSAYQFTPSASDIDSDPLTFSIVNRPAWATFSTSTGMLSGTLVAGNVGTYGSILISVSDGQATASLPAFTLTVQAVNTAPVISGSPVNSVLQDVAYQFAPVASDADSDPLTFSIANQPSWATFDPATGLLSGTPTAGDVGTYANIVISVSDGQASASLPSFSITVNAVSLGSATLSWQAPTTNEDGSPLSNLAGYRIFWGQASGSYSNDVIVMNPGLTTYVVDNLTRGTTYYFAVKALNSLNVESTFSNEASKPIP